LHLTPLAAEEEAPELVKLRAALDHRIGEAQLPDLLLQVDAQVRFSWIMLGREPRSDKELLMVYAGILAHGTSMSAAETARMIPQLWSPTVRTSTRRGERRSARPHASASDRGDLKVARRHHPIGCPESTPYNRKPKIPREIRGVSTGSYCKKIKCTPYSASFAAVPHIINAVSHAPVRANEADLGANASVPIFYCMLYWKHEDDSRYS
jgi:hypothetical protein